MKKAITFASIVTVSGAVSAFTWIPGAWYDIRLNINAPGIEIIKQEMAALKPTLASMKHYDIRTDELAADVRTLSNKIDAKQKHLDENPNIDTATRHYLERELEVDRQELRRKMDMLDDASQSDRQVLASLAAG